MFNTLTIILYILNIGIAIGIIFFSKKSPAKTMLWCVVLLTLPLLGLILYFFFGCGPTLGRQKKLLSKRIKDKRYYDLIDKQSENEEYGKISGKLSREMVLFNAATAAAPCTYNNEAIVYSDIKRLYKDIFQLAADAQNYIHIQSYIFRDDNIGNGLIALLAKKAQGGTVVRLLYDDIGCLKLRKDFFDPLREAGGKVYAFFPSRFKYLNININYRNHRKIVVIDGKYAFTGGANIGEEYIGRNDDVYPFTDCHLRLQGEAVRHLNIRFLQDFSFACSCPVEEGSYEKYEGGGFLPVQALSDGADSGGGKIVSAYIKAIYLAEKRVYLQTPYLIIDEAFTMALASAAASGVDVRVMIPETADKKSVYYATLSYAAELVSLGVKVYKRKGFLHSKTLIVDDEVSSVGSFNLDIRSFYLQFELTCFIYGKEFNQTLSEIFERDLSFSEIISEQSIASRPLTQKLMERLMRLLTPIM